MTDVAAWSRVLERASPMGSIQQPQQHCSLLPQTIWPASAARHETHGAHLIVVEDTVVQDVAAQQYEQEFEAFQSGKYKESAQNWLHSSWQGDALQAGTCLWSSQFVPPLSASL